MYSPAPSRARDGDPRLAHGAGGKYRRGPPDEVQVPREHAYRARHLSRAAMPSQSLADRAANARLLVRRWPDQALGCSACDLSDQLRAGRLLEILAMLDRHHKGAADNAIVVVPIEVIDLYRRIGWLLYHDGRQAPRGLHESGIARPTAHAGYGGAAGPPESGGPQLQRA